MRQICWLYMNKRTDRDVRRYLRMSRRELEEQKLLIAVELKRAGIEVQK